VAYKVSGTAYLKDDKTAETFQNVTVTNFYTLKTSLGSATSFGYASAGYVNPVVAQNTIDKFSFSVDQNATDVGDLTQTRWNLSGQSSSTHGYSSAGIPVPGIGNQIEKFSFSADENSTDVGDLTLQRVSPAGQSSTGSGYVSGGYDTTNPAPPPPLQALDTIDKFSFTSDANATDVGDLTQVRYGAAGQQV